jgi:NDP-sugar pyrophosphorylase family protein
MDDSKEVSAAILAGGLGTRLRPVVADRPKVLARVRNRPFLAYLLEQLISVDIQRVVLCTGHMGEQIRASFGDSFRQLQLRYSHENSPLGTAGALRLALPLLDSDTVLVMNGDSFCEGNLRDFWTWSCERAADAALLLTHVPDTTRYGRVEVNADGRICGFREKDGQKASGWINTGVYLIKRSLLQMIPAERAVSLERDIFPSWVGLSLYGYCNNGRFLDIGTPEAFATAEQFFAAQVSVA